jgi:hypothetical protein
MAHSPSLSEVLDAAERAGKLNLRTEEIRDSLRGVSASALRQALHRQQRRGRLVRLSRGSDHWLLVPLQYADAGAPPLETWLDRYLRRTLGISYYVALLSAAETYGASPYAVMVTQVMVAERRRPITVGRHEVVFYSRSRIVSMPTRWHETPLGRFEVATPELAALELVERATLVGGVPRVREVLRALWSSCGARGLSDALDALQEVPTAQRLGALLTLDGKRTLAESVSAWLHGKPLRLVALDRDPSPRGESVVDERFKVRLSGDTLGANA